MLGQGRLLRYKQTIDIQPMLLHCWASVVDGEPTVKQHWLDVLPRGDNSDLCRARAADNTGLHQATLKSTYTQL